MQYKKIAAVAPLLAVASAQPMSLTKRDGTTWGPIVELGPSVGDAEIVSVLATIYPGEMPAEQNGGLYCWIGINNATQTGDLIQGIVGSYIHGQSECGTGSDADSQWCVLHDRIALMKTNGRRCISAEVYGWSDEVGNYNQYVGDLRTLDPNPSQGVTFNYTMTDSSSRLWVQTATNAKTGDVLATYQKESPQVTMINTAVECVDCTYLTDEQTWTNITIGLSAADENFGSTIMKNNGAESTDPTTEDGGKTWKISKITVPVVTPV
ncbi:uncharacterized protein K452DRAFT_129450 [Aplosporella prunicola CBS 121167]|uniref:Uncharacterized protein n=1 Tax=Aplosporella prunicola CBS 121167 TaxID=1176127 RepID=A0A6A6AXM5_9PEZI|nr:uncharacterized protein K452DRAFT_129450 [Aplosporella prunicola CBS 121167]KAF2136510.1 hypothetical protein K452DRAFT_129450 [Aplosporella prunicola CBS 121167]